MKKANNQIIFSPSDLSNHISCQHITTLNMDVLLGKRTKPINNNRVLDMLRKKGTEFEESYLRELANQQKQIVVINADGENPEQDTINAMKKGADIIYQARLVKNPWQGWADFLIRVDKPSDFGSWSYEVLDTKLATQTRAGTILQITLYSEIVGSIQGCMPEYMYVKKPDSVTTYRVDDYISFVRFTKKRLIEAVKNNPTTYPEPLTHCDICNWWAECNARRREDDHLGFVAGMGSSQTKEFRKQNVNTLRDLSIQPVPLNFTPSRGAIETYNKLREQARIQQEAKDQNLPKYELLPLDPPKAPEDTNRGFYNLPEPTGGDIFLDFEGDPLVDPSGREYLFGWLYQGEYICIWAETEQAEKDALERFVDFVIEKKNEYPNLHIYHYAPYEPSALKRLMGKYATRENEIDSLLRSQTFVDLHSIVKQSLRASVEKYSIKDLEKFYGFVRELDLRILSKYKMDYEYLLETNLLHDETPELNEKISEMKLAIEQYNKDDCLSTLKLQEWLESLRSGLIGQFNSIPRPSARVSEASENITEHQQRIMKLFAPLMNNVPVNRDERTEIQQAQFILAHMLDWFRREQKSYWWELFRLKELPDQEFLDERNALTGLELIGPRVDDKKSVIDAYTFPIQECDIRKDKEIKNKEGVDLGKVIDIDLKKRIIKIRKGPSKKDIHPTSIFFLEKFSAKEKEESIIRFAEWVIKNGLDSDSSEFRATRDLLLHLKPRTTAPLISTQDQLEKTLDWVKKLDNSVLPIQGPPGAGKSYTASHLILKLVQSGKKIGITALSHKVITGLIEKTWQLSKDAKLNLRIIQKISNSIEEFDKWKLTTDNKEVIAKINDFDIIAGTSFLWCLPELYQSVDYLIVDEAGQLSLIDTIAIGQAARNLILLGDPQQLQQPQKGVHPEGTDCSALEHLLQGHKTIADDQGIFLKQTWRMHPNVCSFDSEMFYEGKLSSSEGLANQSINGNTKYAGAGLWYEFMNHTGNINASEEEAAKVCEIVQELTKGDVYWVDAKNNQHLLNPNHIKIICPYNAQVQLLLEKLPDLEIGTVDKFQGQEAPVIIYSMATSSPEDAPRGMDFLYSPNRLNVAVSRAKVCFIMVANSKLFEPECKSPEQIKLANPFCRFLESAIVSSEK